MGGVGQGSRETVGVLCRPAWSSSESESTGAGRFAQRCQTAWWRPGVPTSSHSRCIGRAEGTPGLGCGAAVSGSGSEGETIVARF